MMVSSYQLPVIEPGQTSCGSWGSWELNLTGQKGGVYAPMFMPVSAAQADTWPKWFLPPPPVGGRGTWSGGKNVDAA